MNGMSQFVKSRVWAAVCGGRPLGLASSCAVGCLIMCLGELCLSAPANGQAVVVQLRPEGSGEKAKSPASTTALPSVGNMEASKVQTAPVRVNAPTVGPTDGQDSADGGAAAAAVTGSTSPGDAVTQDTDTIGAVKEGLKGDGLVDDSAMEGKSNGDPAIRPDSPARAKGKNANKDKSKAKGKANDAANEKRSPGKGAKARKSGDESTGRGTSKQRHKNVKDAKSVRGNGKTGVAKMKRDQVTTKINKIKLSSSKRAEAKDRAK